jgi:iron complex transport system substrate-binding protein
MKLFRRSLLYFILFLVYLTPVNVFADTIYPKRVVSLSPSITEIIYGLDAWDKVVGVTMYSDFPPEVKDVQKVGGWVNPNLEMILKLKPDLVIMLTDQEKIFGDKIKALGLKTLAVDSNPSVIHIKDSIVSIGKKLGKQKESIKLSGDIEAEISRVRSKIINLKPKKVLCVIGRNPGTLDDIYVVGNTSFINELISLSGGINVIEKKRTALKISKEAIFALDPDIIIEINHEKIDKEKEIREVWSMLGEARAIKNNQFKVISSSAILHPSQRIIDGLKKLITLIHPEVLT